MKYKRKNKYKWTKSNEIDTYAQCEGRVQIGPQVSKCQCTIMRNHKNLDHSTCSLQKGILKSRFSERKL